MARTVRRRARRGGGNPDWVLWVVGGIIVVGVGRWLAEAVAANWPLVIGVTGGLVVMVAGGLVLRYRVIRARERRWLEDNSRLERLDAMNGERFEMFVEALLRSEGFHRVHRIGKTGDGGVDIVAVSPGGEPLVIQCKRWAKPVGSPEVRNLLGALHAYPGHRGVLITTATFTIPARQCAADTDLILIDRAPLAAWLSGSFTLPLKG